MSWATEGRAYKLKMNFLFENDERLELEDKKAIANSLTRIAGYLYAAKLRARNAEHKRPTKTGTDSEDSANRR